MKNNDVFGEALKDRTMLRNSMLCEIDWYWRYTTLR